MRVLEVFQAGNHNAQREENKQGLMDEIAREIDCARRNGQQQRSTKRSDSSQVSAQSQDEANSRDAK